MLRRVSVNWLFVGIVAALFCCRSVAGVEHPTGTPAWPSELPEPLNPGETPYVSERSNVILDLHGSTQDPDLVIFMAGNQYRVLPELLPAFREWTKAQPRHKPLQIQRIFYATTPPGRLIDAMQRGRIVLGNFWIDVRPGALWPDIFMTGPRQQRRLAAARYVDRWSIYTRNRGVVLLIQAGNPKNVRGIGDLMREDVRVAMSSPMREPDSFESYSNTLRAQGSPDLPERILKKPGTISPVTVHHRENPQFIFDGRADVAPMYYHFGDYLKTRLPQQFDYVSLPAEGNFRDELAISVIRDAPHPEAAAAWLEFIRSDTAAAIYNRHGFDYASHEERTRTVER
jgi:molybdate transport system substrate-binding protein